MLGDWSVGGWSFRDEELRSFLELRRKEQEPAEFAQLFMDRLEAATSAEEAEYVRDTFLYAGPRNDVWPPKMEMAYRQRKVALLVSGAESPREMEDALAYLMEALKATTEPTPRNWLRYAAEQLIVSLAEARLRAGGELLPKANDRSAGVALERHVLMLQALAKAVDAVMDSPREDMVGLKHRLLTQEQEIRDALPAGSFKEEGTKAQRVILKRLSPRVRRVIGAVIVLVAAAGTAVGLVKGASEVQKPKVVHDSAPAAGKSPEARQLPSPVSPASVHLRTACSDSTIDPIAGAVGDTLPLFYCAGLAPGIYRVRITGYLGVQKVPNSPTLGCGTCSSFSATVTLLASSTEIEAASLAVPKYDKLPALRFDSDVVVGRDQILRLKLAIVRSKLVLKACPCSGGRTYNDTVSVYVSPKTLLDAKWMSAR